MVMTPTCRRRPARYPPVAYRCGAEFENAPRRSAEFRTVIIIILTRRRSIFSFHNAAYRKSPKNVKTGQGNIMAFYIILLLCADIHSCTDAYTHVYICGFCNIPDTYTSRTHL